MGVFAVDEMWTRVGEQLMARVSGPLHFRLYLQPGMAAALAIIGGIRDAKAGKPPYLWALMTDRVHYKEMIKDGWKSIWRVFILALVLDIIYQAYVLHFFYLGEAIIVAVVLALIPYILLRGTVRRVAIRWLKRTDASAGAPPGAPPG